MSEEKFYTASQVEKLLGVSKSTMKRLIKAKKIKAVKFGENVQGNPWRISESALAEFKNNGHSNVTEGEK